MTYTLKRAVREQTPLLIGLVGPSGCGKTYSALRLAAGIQQVSGGRIAGIDTEARRMLHYADKFDFDHLQMPPPFGSLNYLEAIQCAIDSGAKTVIVDSMSHEHEGAGGYLELHENELDRIAGDDYKKRERCTFLAWQKPAAARRKLINFMLQVNVNFIFCFRAKEKLKLVKGQEPIQLGWQAIAGEEFVFEMLVRCLLPPGSEGTPDWSAESWALGVPKIADGVRPVFNKPRQLDEWTGKQLARWATGAGADHGTGPTPEKGGPAPTQGQSPERTSIEMDAAAMVERGNIDDALALLGELDGPARQRIQSLIDLKENAA